MLRENDIISKVLLTIDQYKGKVSLLRKGVASDDYLKSPNYSRLLVWKVCLITNTLDIAKWEEALTSSRVVYSQLVKRADMRVPWHQLDPDDPFYRAELPVSRSGSRRQAAAPQRGIKNVIERTKSEYDPLNSGGESRSALPVPIGPDDLNLLKQITLDIERIFPGNEFFHSPTPSSLRHRRALVQILYVWAKCNPTIGYKQGVHELLGLIYLNLCQESIECPNTNTMSVDDIKILRLYNYKSLLHDTFTIFNAFINKSGIAAAYFEQETRLSEAIQDFNVQLLKVDQLIHYNLTAKLKLELQLWLIRYFRLLLSRELGGDLEVVMRLWEKLISCGGAANLSLASIPELVSYMVIILLIHIKTELIQSDFSEALVLLLHYPASRTFAKYPHRANEFVQTLYSDAIQLYELRGDDLKLYEFGMRLNDYYNPNLKIKMSYAGSPRSSDGGNQTKEEKIKFEKYRLEMRLKKKAQDMVQR